MARALARTRPTARAAVGATLIAGALSSWSSPAAASPSARLVYSRSPEVSSCPGEGAMRSAVAARFGYDPFFPWAKQTVVVQLSRRHTRYVARIQLLDEEGIAHGTREITSDQATCAEIFDAAALAISIALDAAARANPEGDAKPAPPSPSASAGSSPNAEAPAPPPAPLPAPTSAPPPVPPPAPPAPPAPTPPTHEVAAAARPGRPDFSFGIDLLGVLGDSPNSPELAPGIAAFARATEDAWSVSLELRGEAAESATRAQLVGGGSVESAVYASLLVPCRHWGYFAACLVGAMGIEAADARDITPHFAKTTLYAAAGGRLEFEWPFSAVLSLRIRVETVANLHRATLVLGDDSIWEADALSASGGAGLAVRFR